MLSLLNSTVTLTQNLSQVSHDTLNVSLHYTSLQKLELPNCVVFHCIGSTVQHSLTEYDTIR